MKPKSESLLLVHCYLSDLRVLVFPKHIFGSGDDSEVQEYIQVGDSSSWMSRKGNNNASKVYLIQGMLLVRLAVRLGECVSVRSLHP